MSSHAELDQCRASLKGGSRSFHLASRLLPRRVREPASVLYAFCREADDLIDEGGGAEAVEILRQRLRTLAPDTLLADVMSTHHVPLAVLESLIEGFAWDVEGRRYEDIDTLMAYAMRVAGTVGLAMALVMGARGRRALQAAAALGLAMQLTNICRDVADDAKLGRLYLPAAWMREAGLDPVAWLANPRPSAALNGVVVRVLGLADALYALGDEGIATLPKDCHLGIRAARKLYAEIGHTLRRQGGDPLAGRTIVGLPGKVLCMLRAGGGKVSPAQRSFAEGLAEHASASLIEALPAILLTPLTAGDPAPGRIVWVLELFERLERRSAALRDGGGALRT